MNGKHFAPKKRPFANAVTAGKKISSKEVLLSIVAIIEIILILITATYAWVETISTIVITGDGNIDTYTYTRAEIGTSSASIDLSKYFREAGNAHLSSVSTTDGKSFIVPITAKTGTVSSNFREANVNDKNVNYIEYTFRVKVDAKTEFYFNQVPEIKIGGETITDNSVRFSITTGGSTTIYSNLNQSSRVANSVNSTIGATSGTNTSSVTPQAFSSHLIGGDPVFTLQNSTDGVDVTIRMWLQDGANNAKYAGKDIVVNKFRLVTENTKTTEVTFIDDTSAFNSSVNGYHWVENNNNVMYVYNAATSEIVQMSKSKADPTRWTADVLSTWFSSNLSAKLSFYCCTSSATLNVSNSSTYLVKWDTTPQKAVNSLSLDNRTSYTYTAYGNVTSSTSKTGYGTWRDVIGIQLGTEDFETLPSPARALDATQVYVTRQGATSEKIEMNYGTEGEASYWRAYVPKYTSESGKTIVAYVNFTFSTTDGQTTTSHNLYAYNRYTDQDSSRYIVTSSSTGYWEPPVTVNVKIVCADTKETGGVVTVSGGKEGASTVKVTAGTSVTVKAIENPDAFANEHYVFKGWFTDEACTNALCSASITSWGVQTAQSQRNTTVTYYAKFIKTYKVSVYTVLDESKATDTNAAGVKILTGNGYDPGYQAQYAVYVEPGKKGISINTQLNDSVHYSFSGWYNSQTGGSLKYSMQEVKFNEQSAYSKGIQGDVELYARYKPKTIVVEIHRYTSAGTSGGSPGLDNSAINGGSIRISYGTGTASASDPGDYIKMKEDAGLKYGQEISFTAIANTANGYEFKGWYSDWSTVDDTTLVSSEANVKLPLNNANGCIKTDENGDEYYCIYAYFKIKSYTITATVSNGTDADASVGKLTCSTNSGNYQTSSTVSSISTTINYGTNAAFTATAEDGYVFKGWYTTANPSSSTSALSTNAQYTITGSDTCIKNIYAVFAKDKVVTTVYFAPRGYSKPCAYAYEVGNTSNELLGDWFNNEKGGTELEKDTYTYTTSSGSKYSTGLYKVTFDTLEADKSFGIIVNDGGNVNKQYPATQNAGLVGKAGGTYFFDEGSPTSLISIDDSTACIATFHGSTNSSSSFSGGSYTRYGTTYSSTQTFAYYKNQPVKATATNNSGYSFDGWFTNSACTTYANNKTNIDTTVTSSTALNFYAKFTKNSTYTIKLTNNYNWSSVYCYYWSDSNQNMVSWPGASMSWSYNNDYDQGVYTIDIPADATHIIFNNGNNEGQQTVDITVSGSANYYISSGSGTSCTVGTW